ncbi:MAG TPA: hypothetical protein VGL72_14810 [Bryobacteraceae bacterium]
MNETVLSILMIAGLLVIAATVWLAVRSRNSKRTQPAPEAQPDPQAVSQQLVPAGSGPSVPALPVRTAQPVTSLVVPATDAAIPMRVLQSGENSIPDVPALLLKAYEQLSTRQHRIESELARIEQLRGEREAVAVQAAALDQAMKAFAVSPALSHQIDPYRLETNGTRSSEKMPA